MSKVGLSPGAMLIVGGLMLMYASAASADDAARSDWPQFLGPDRDGTTIETGWRTDWDARPPEKIWERDVGTGYGSVAVRDGRLYTMGHVDRTRDVVWCLDAATGDVIWKHSYSQRGGGAGYPGPRATPTLDGDYVYTLSIEGKLLCLDDSDDGEVVWSRDVREDFSGRAGRWGFASSPLVLGDMLIVDAGTVVALNKEDGELIWQSGEYQAGYSSPVAFEHQGRTLLAIFNASGLVILNAEDGTKVAEHPWRTSYDVNAALPLIVDDRIFITSGYRTGGALLKLTDDGLEEIWKSGALGSQFSSVILKDGYLYGFDGNVGGARLKCVEFETGREVWEHRESGAMILAGGKFLIQGQSGRLAVAEPTPDGYEELSSFTLPRDRWWNIAALSGGHIYARSHGGTLVCLDVHERQ